MSEGVHFESEYYLSLTYLPPIAREERIKGWMFEGMKDQRGNAGRILDYFKSRIASFEDVFKSLFAVMRLKAVRTKDDAGNPVVHDELLRYVHRCVSWKDHPLRLPEFPVFLNDMLATEDFVGGLTPRIGRKHLRVLRSMDSPRQASQGFSRRSIRCPSNTAGTRGRFSWTRKKRVRFSIRSERNGVLRCAA